MKSDGKLVRKLEESGELDNMIIMFLSDNRASSEHPSQYGPGFDRAGSTRDGREVLFPVKKKHLPGPQTVHAGIGPEWADVSNTPLRYYKARVYEGGIATPFIVHWPQKLRTKEVSPTKQATSWPRVWRLPELPTLELLKEELYRQWMAKAFSDCIR